jgi:hypothetical protein
MKNKKRLIFVYTRINGVEKVRAYPAWEVRKSLSGGAR